MTYAYTIGPTVEKDEALRRDMEEQARRRQEAYAARVRRLTELLLTLGQDAPAMLADARALQEAVSSASSAWEKLVGLEAQILRERSTLVQLEAGLEATPKVRKPFESMDDIRRSDERRALETRVEDARASVEALTADAKTMRADLERVAGS